MKFPVTSLESVAFLSLGTMRVYGNKEEQTKQRQKKGKLGKLYINYPYIALIPRVPSLLSQKRNNYSDSFVYQETLEQKSNGTKFAI